MSTTSWMPRGHREPNVLHRRTRWLEDAVWLLLTVLVVAAAAICLAVAVSVHGTLSEQTRELATERRQTPALVVSDSTTTTSPASGRYRTEISWTGRDGLPRTGRASLTAHRETGEIVEVWVDSEDRLAAAPPSSHDVVVVAGVTWLFGTSVSVLGVALLGRLLLA